MKPACECGRTPCCCGSRLGPGLVIGLIFIAIGSILLLDRFGVLYASDILRYWPVILILLGLCNLFNRECTGSRVGGAILIVLGAILLADRIGYWHVHFRDLWPLLLIAVGTVLLWKAIEGHRAPAPAPASTARLNEFTVFGGVERRISSQEFEGGRATAVFGGVELDLRQAAIKGTQAVIEANAVFGGVEIRVPESWTVNVQGVGVFGGYTDETRHTKPAEGAAAQELVVRGGAVFGAVEVKN